MLELWRRRLLWVAAAALGIFGFGAFANPDWAAGAFPWKVGPLLAMTIGGWALGTSALGAMAASTSRLDRTLGMNVYLLLFGVLQGLVALAFLDKLLPAHVLTWPYLIGLVALAASAVVGVADWWSRRPDLRGPVGMVPLWMKAIVVGLGAFTAFLAAGTLISGPDGQVAQGRFFPEQLSLFSIRAFSAFFATVAGGTLSLLLARNPRPYFELDRGGFVLVLAISIASLIHVSRFDFAAKPGGLAYLGAYVVAMVAFGVIWLLAPYRPDLFAADPPGS